MSSDEVAAWPLSAAAAEQINRIRKRAGLNREQLAEKCQGWGAPASLSAAAIANIETGRPGPDGQRRRDLTVEELVILAAALGVPPILLLVPVGVRELIEVLPGRVMSAWDAIEWFTGEAPLATWQGEGQGAVVSGADFTAWETGAAPVDYYRQQAALFRRRAATSARGDEQELRGIDEQLADLRRTMRRAGIRTWRLTPNLIHIDEEETRDGSTEDQTGPGR